MARSTWGCPERDARPGRAIPDRTEPPGGVASRPARGLRLEFVGVVDPRRAVGPPGTLPIGQGNPGAAGVARRILDDSPDRTALGRRLALPASGPRPVPRRSRTEGTRRAGGDEYHDPAPIPAAGAGPSPGSDGAGRHVPGSFPRTAPRGRRGPIGAGRWRVTVNDGSGVTKARGAAPGSTLTCGPRDGRRAVVPDRDASIAVAGRDRGVRPPDAPAGRGAYAT